MNRLDGQVAWISGGASGIGAATCRQFALEGASVVIADVLEEPGRKLADGINAGGGRALFSQCDVSDESQVKESINATVSQLGGLQTIVNCAGIVHVGHFTSTAKPTGIV